MGAQLHASQRHEEGRHATHIPRATITTLIPAVDALVGNEKFHGLLLRQATQSGRGMNSNDQLTQAIANGQRIVERKGGVATNKNKDP